MEEKQSRLIVEVLSRYIDRAKTAVIQRGYRFLEGSLMLMEGDPDAGYQLMAQGIEDHEITPGYYFCDRYKRDLAFRVLSWFGFRSRRVTGKRCR